MATVGFDARYINDRYHGIGRHAYGLLEALTRLDSSSEFVVYVNPSYSNTRFDLGVIGGRRNVRLKPATWPLYSVMEQLRWPATLVHDQVSIFHSPYVTVPVLAPARLLLTIHDLIFERFPQYMPRRAYRTLYRAQLRMAIQRASAVLTVSQATAIELANHYPAAAKVSVIGNAVSPTFVPVRDSQRLLSARARYELAEPFVLAVGMSRPHKNFATLVDAFARVVSRIHTPHQLVLAGGVDERFVDSVGARVAEHGLSGRIRRIWATEDDLPALYSLAEVLVVPSIIEGFGLPALEAMSCGTPVLASKIPAVLEVTGDAALTFDPLDRVELAELLERTLRDAALRSDLSERGLARARTFTWERVARRVLGVYSAIR